MRAEITNPAAFQAAASIRGGAGLAPVVSRGQAGYPAELFQAPEWVRRSNESAAGFYRGYYWASRVKFRLDDPDQALEALILAHLLSSGELRARWERLDAVFGFHFGGSEEFDLKTLGSLMRGVYGADATLAELADGEALERFIEGARELQRRRAEENPTLADREPAFALFVERSWPLEEYLTAPVSYTHLTLPTKRIV